MKRLSLIVLALTSLIAVDSKPGEAQSGYHTRRYRGRTPYQRTRRPQYHRRPASGHRRPQTTRFRHRVRVTGSRTHSGYRVPLPGAGSARWRSTKHGNFRTQEIIPLARTNHARREYYKQLGKFARSKRSPSGATMLKRSAKMANALRKDYNNAALNRVRTRGDAGARLVPGLYPRKNISRLTRQGHTVFEGKDGRLYYDKRPNYIPASPHRRIYTGTKRSSRNAAQRSYRRPSSRRTTTRRSTSRPSTSRSYRSRATSRRTTSTSRTPRRRVNSSRRSSTSRKRSTRRTGSRSRRTSSRSSNRSSSRSRRPSSRRSSSNSRSSRSRPRSSSLSRKSSSSPRSSSSSRRRRSRR